ncbi:unnamed protein product [Urochloa decumbens]|uniref:Uncharacterized protein n=1 Tax=Urochloa decumbens TaxID=240449 RepID=A0ABC9ACN4_9POAL
MKNGSLSLSFPTNEPFAFPGLRSDIEALEKGIFGNLSCVLNEAERMTNDFFKSFGFPSNHDRESSPFPRQPAQRHIEEGTTTKKTKEGDYSEFSSQISDVTLFCHGRFARPFCIVLFSDPATEQVCILANRLCFEMVCFVLN